MQISSETQVEMYNYLLNDRISGNNFIDSNSQDFLINSIKLLAKKLNGRAELFIRKANLRMDGDTLKMGSNYICSSNHLIYYVLNNIGGCSSLLKQLGETEQINKLLHSVFIRIPVEFEAVPESNSSTGRGKMIKLCKLYMSEKEMEITSKKKSEDKDFIAKESALAEKSLRKYSSELKNEIVVQPNNIKSRLDNALALKSDIILNYGDRAVIIDIKVYSSISTRDDGILFYKYNTNRYQVNSYIGAYLNKNSTISKTSGLIIHIVNHELYEKNKELQGADLTIETDRPIRLFLIEDKGLDSIFVDYSKIVESTLLN